MYVYHCREEMHTDEETVAQTCLNSGRKHRLGENLAHASELHAGAV
jgi:hypothetical protein